MLIERALVRETFAATLAVTLVLMALFIAVSLVNILARAATGEIPVAIVFHLLGLRTLSVLSLVLPLTFYLGILHTLGRWYRDSEMTVLAACGVGLGRLVRPLLGLGMGVALVVALIAFYLQPLSHSLIAKAKRDHNALTEVSDIPPGTFTEIRKPPGIAFIENVDKDRRTLEGIFLSRVQDGRHAVIIARHGESRQDEDTGDRLLILEQGAQYEGAPGQGDYRVVEFGRYTVRLELQAGRTTVILRQDSTPTGELLTRSDPEAQAELHWRAAKPLTVLVLAVLAPVFAFTHPRARGRYTGVFLAVAVHFLYSNLLGVGLSLIKQDRIAPEAGLWWVHALFLALGALLLYRRACNLPLWPRVLHRASS